MLLGYIFGPRLRENPYYATVIRNQLTKHLASTFADIQDEIAAGFTDCIPATADGDSVLCNCGTKSPSY